MHVRLGPTLAAMLASTQEGTPGDAAATAAEEDPPSSLSPVIQSCQLNWSGEDAPQVTSPKTLLAQAGVHT